MSLCTHAGLIFVSHPVAHLGCMPSKTVLGLKLMKNECKWKAFLILRQRLHGLP